MDTHDEDEYGYDDEYSFDYHNMTKSPFEDEYDDEETDSTTKSTNSKATQLFARPPPTLTTSQMPILIEEETVMLSKVELCPEQCKCTDGAQIIDCSHRNLTECPSYLPTAAIQLNLSHNNIEEINGDCLLNSTELREILLNNNQIKSIDKNVS